MSRKWVVNASPLILLGKIEQIKLLETLSNELTIPDSVVAEINAGGNTDVARKWVSVNGSRYIRPVRTIDPIIAAWDLGAGESAVLTFVRQNMDTEAILDDRAARNCAKALQIPVRGTLGVILLAKRERLIPTVKPLIDALIAAGLRIDAATIASVLNLAGERTK